jgi:hypothetical protein
MAETSPTSFRLRAETLAQLDRLAALLTARRHDEAGEGVAEHRPVTRAEAVGVAVSSTLGRLQGERPRGPRPYGAAAEAGRGMLAGVGTGAAVEQLMAERRAEANAEAEEAAATAPKRR